MGPDFMDQVSAWKIYKVTWQWEADTQSSYLPSTLGGPVPYCSNTQSGFSSYGDIFFPFNPLSFLIHASQIRCSHTAESYVSGSAGGHILVCWLKTEESGTRGIGSSHFWKGKFGVSYASSGMEEAVVHVILFHNRRLDDIQSSWLETPHVSLC